MRGVVLAQRLEQLAEAGGVVVQGAISETVPTRMPFQFKNLGERTLKGFDTPVRAIATTIEAGEVVPPPEPADSVTASEHVVPSVQSSERPRLAVLPFTTVGHQPETEELADGLTDVVINTLSRTGQSEIVDRASVFAYKDRSSNPTEVANLLGAQHVLQGNIQKFGDKVRITAELFDAHTGKQPWSERYDRVLNDPFELQDDIAKRITQSVRTVVVHGVEWEYPTDNFDAWLLNIQAVEHYISGSAEHNHESRQLLTKVIELDPTFAWGPHNQIHTYWFDCLYG